MTLRTALARLARRDPDRPTLRERMAAGRARLGRLARRPEAAPDADAGRRVLMGGALAAAVPLPALAAPSDLARACDAAVAHMAWINANTDPWDDARLYAEIGRFDVVVRRAGVEPSVGIGDLAAKARLLLTDWAEHIEGADLNDGERALGTLLREVAALAPQSPHVTRPAGVTEA